MADEVGKLIKKEDVKSGVSKGGKQWQKMTFVIQVKDTNFPRQVAFDTFNAQLIQMVSDTNIDTLLRVTYDIKSREHNGNWYSNINAWKVEIERETGNTVTPPPEFNQVHEAEDDGNDLPF
jgi:hypothetical protein